VEIRLKEYKYFEIERDFFNKLGVLIDGDFKSSEGYDSVPFNVMEQRPSDSHRAVFCPNSVEVVGKINGGER
jgi:hypothetical protein